MAHFMKAGDPVWIIPYDVTWPEQFHQLAQPLRHALGPVALRIDHIGSTAVAGLAAKPVIDIQISVADFEPLDAYRLPLERLGYLLRFSYANVRKHTLTQKFVVAASSVGASM